MNKEIKEINKDMQYIIIGNKKYYGIAPELLDYVFNLQEENKILKEQQDEIENLNNIINECAEDILKELKENNHLSYGVALSIRQKLISYKELKEVNKNVE